MFHKRYVYWLCLLAYELRFYRRTCYSYKKGFDVMPYGELRFDDEEDSYEEECEICGFIGGHDPNCVMNTDDFESKEEGFE